MKDWQKLEGAAQKEALLNELKGNIFEFLLASLIARGVGCESEFIHHFSSIESGKVMADFQRYQKWLLEQDPELYRQLPALASKAYEFLKGESALFKGYKPSQVFLTGKWSSGGASDQSQFLKESDLLLVDKDNHHKGLSLKLCKKGAFVNTKSGGIRSFIEKYFAAFEKAGLFQQELNDLLDKSFSELTTEMYQWADLPLIRQDERATQFDPSWQEKGYPVLPGELPDDAKTILHAHYQRVIGKLYELMEKLWQSDAQLFGDALLPLVGLGAREVAQLTCFHTTEKEQRYQLSSFKYKDADDFDGLRLKAWPKLKEGISSFEFRLGDQALQIRVKPMNTFIVSGLKVNCSLKSLKK